jgi:DNA-binding transcriptional ArsR family regulator
MMMRKISGHELRDSLVSRKQEWVSRPTEEMRIEALSSAGNRELLEIIATRRPRSISELATLAKRLQPNVSRSINALARAGLLTAETQGRSTVPCLTAEGERKAKDLGFIKTSGPEPESPQVSPAEPTEASPPLRAQEPVLSAIILATTDQANDSDAVEADVTARLRADKKSAPTVVHARVDLNAVCTDVLANWWSVLCRREDPYKMFALQRKTGDAISPAVLFARATGRMELFVRSTTDEDEQSSPERHSLTVDEFTDIVLNELARPLVDHLRARKRFDRPVESLLHRTEEILQESDELLFWRTAGALGLTYRDMTDAGAKNVAALLNAIADEGARLDFASATDSDWALHSLIWAQEEITKKAEQNNLPRLIELRQGEPIDLGGVEPWRTGKDRAREARAQIGLAQDRPVGGLAGLSRLFADDHCFAPSAAGEEILRGFQGFSKDLPVVVVRDEGPRSTAFLMTRAIGDYLVYGSHEAPVADIYSDRQAVGRKFAAEFMAPAEAVVHMIDVEHKSKATVADHFGVGRGVVNHQYENSVAQYAH